MLDALTAQSRKPLRPSLASESRTELQPVCAVYCYTPGMAQRRFEPVGSGRRRNVGKVALLIVALVLLFGASTVAGYVIEYQWWQEMGQVQTWLDMLWYGLAPEVAATLVAFLVLWIA